MYATSARTWILSTAAAAALALGVLTVAGDVLHQARTSAAIASGEIKVVKLDRVVVTTPAPTARVIKRTTLALVAEGRNTL